MRIAVYLPFFASVLLAVAGPRATRRMPPRTATRLLLAAGLACAVSSLLALVLLASTLVGQIAQVAAVGDWSRTVLDRNDPVSPLIAGLAGVTLIMLCAAIAWTALRYVGDIRRVHRADREFGHTGRLVVLDQPDPEAFALPGHRGHQGRIVVSTGLLRIMDAAERSVLLAHETAHLRHRHYRHRALARLIAAANPLLVTLPAAIHQLTERWADEDAAAVVTDRKIAARALARAAIATRSAARRSPTAGAVLCFDRSGVPTRVRALLAGEPRRRPLLTVLLTAFLAATLLTACEAGRDTVRLFDQAGDVHHG